MPEKKEIIDVQGYSAVTLQLLGYGSLQNLNWTIKYAGEDSLVAYTLKKWGQKGDLITVKTEDNRIAITSKLIHGESFDLAGKNKKNINKLIGAFEETKNNATDEQKQEWAAQINILKESTIKAIEEESKQAAEIDKAMNLSTGNRNITYGIIGINALIFILMVISGVNFFAPSGIDIIKWGANYAPLTLSGDWWRLITCVFVHIGIIHIAFNMYALLSIGIYLEPMLGKARYITAYLCTGIFASLTSLWWHTSPVSSAGASGAIFGMYGVFLALLTTNIIPKQMRKSLLQSIGIFIAYNLLYGMKSGVDNSAHLGGLISGFLIGYSYYFSLKGETKRAKNLVTGSIAVLTVLIAGVYLETKKVSPSEREAINRVIDNSKYKETEKFDEKYNDIIEAQNKALAPIKDTSLNDQERVKSLKAISLPEWERAEKLAEELKLFTDVPVSQKKKAEIMSEYIAERKKETDIIIRMFNQYNVSLNIDLAGEREKIDSLVTALNGL